MEQMEIVKKQNECSMNSECERENALTAKCPGRQWPLNVRSTLTAQLPFSLWQQLTIGAIQMVD